MAPACRHGRVATFAALLVAPLLVPTDLGAADISRFRPPMTADGLLGADGAEGLHPLQLSFAAYLNYGRNPLVWYYEADNTYEPIIGQQLTLDLVASAGVWERVDLSMALPVVLVQKGPARALLAGVELAGAGVGDLRITPRITLLRQRSYGIGLAVIPELTFPTGDERRFLGNGDLSFRPRVVADMPLVLLPVRLIAGLGYSLRKDVVAGDADLGDEIPLQDEWLFHLGGVVDLSDLVGLPVSAMVEFAGATAAGDPFSFEGLNALEGLLGARYRLFDDWLITAGVAAGLTRGLGTASYRFILGGAWAPQPPDRDQDGIPDFADGCPDGPEDYDRFEDSDGCPDADNDGDGILDRDDQCPNEKEDFNRREDDDGCPEAPRQDTDRDGVLDQNDECPREPEDLDGYEDFDGCPDEDHDHDGVLDYQDECPDEKETINGIDDEDGCPDEGEGVTEYVESVRIQIKESIHFESGKSTIKQKSKAILDQVALQILAHPEIQRLRIEGHTDSIGDEEQNLSLSQNRADAVRRYLIEKGVPERKLEASGYGETMPIASNATAAGRAINRRVEFLILQTR